MINIVFDVDDVIIRTVDSIIQVYNNVAKENGLVELSTNKNEKREGKNWINIILEKYGSLKNFNNQFCKEIHENLNVNKGLVDFINQISKKTNIFLFTKPHSIKELSTKLNIIYELFGEVGDVIAGVITITGDELDKGMIKIDRPILFVDDIYSNLVKVNAEHKIMYRVWELDTKKAIEDDNIEVAFDEEDLIHKIEEIIDNGRVDYFERDSICNVK